jgi:hypothetical protein
VHLLLVILITVIGRPVAQNPKWIEDRASNCPSWPSRMEGWPDTGWWFKNSVASAKMWRSLPY